MVNPASLGRIVGLLRESDLIDVAYDLLLARLVHDAVLKAYVLFPFVTTVAESAQDSQIQGAGKRDAERVWQTFRKMVWLERSEATYRPPLGQIRTDLLDDELMDFAVLFAAPASARFNPK
jgi:hypothetical protein